MLSNNKKQLEDFMVKGGSIKTIILSNKTTIIEQYIYDTQNCDADEFLPNITEYVQQLNTSYSNISCILILIHPEWDHNEYMQIFHNMNKTHEIYYLGKLKWQD